MDEQGRSGEQTHNGAGLADATRWSGRVRADHEGREPAVPVAGRDPAAPASPPSLVSSALGGSRPDSDSGAGAGDWAHRSSLASDSGGWATSGTRVDRGADAGDQADSGGWTPAPGLDDDVPVDGGPPPEPPLWREAARRAPTSPGPARWEPGEHAWHRPAPYRGSRVVPADRPTDPGAARPAAAPPAPDPAPRGHAGTAPGDLPRRVPAEPDVPDVGEAPGPQPRAEAPELARIATRLRRDDVPRETPTDGFDVDAVLAAVRDVPGVREASVRPGHTGAHTLRLDLAEDADPVQVSRVVARMLQARMGLSAAPRYVPHARTLPEDRADSTGVAAAAGGGGGTTDGPAADTGAAGGATGTDAVTDAGAATGAGAAGTGERPGAPPVAQTGPRVVIDHVQVNVVGLHATVEVRLAAGHRRALGLASGPAIDSYVVRLAAVSAAKAIDELMAEPPPGDRPSRCFIEHTGVVPFGGTEVAVVVVMLVCGGWVEQLAGSAVVDGDARHAAVRATLGAVNRRLDALLAG